MPAEDQGIDLTRYMVIPRTLIFITRGENVLLLKGSEKKRLWPGLYNGIGGHVENGEDIYSAAQRELREEAGLISTDLELRGVLTVETRVNPGICVFIFVGSCLEENFEQSHEGSLYWINISDISSLPLVEDLPTLLPEILHKSRDKRIFFAYSEHNEDGNLIVHIK
jgi:8-oxo-dGTP diphosphatase